MKFSPDSPVLASLLTPTQRAPLTTRTPSPKAKAEAHRVAALKALRHWGHLRCADLARILWPNATYAEQLARRLMLRLDQERGEVISRLNALGTRSYVLTRRGAAALDGMGFAAHHGMELSSVGGATFIHRTLGTAVGILKAHQGFEAYGEHAIAQGMAPAKRDALVKRYKKLPDMLLVKGGKATWLEVEASAKPLAELQACSRITSAVGQPLTPGSPILLAGVAFAFDASQGHAQRIARAAREEWRDLPPAVRQKLSAHVTLMHLDLGPSLRWKGMQESSLLVV